MPGPGDLVCKIARSGLHLADCTLPSEPVDSVSCNGTDVKVTQDYLFVEVQKVMDAGDGCSVRVSDTKFMTLGTAADAAKEAGHDFFLCPFRKKHIMHPLSRRSVASTEFMHSLKGRIFSFSVFFFFLIFNFFFFFFFFFFKKNFF